MKDQTKVIAALLIGAAAGAALGLLLAPEKGETVRDGIADYINDLVETAKNKAESTGSGIKEFGNNVYSKAKSKFDGLVGDAEDYRDETVDTVKDQAQKHYDSAKTKVKATSNDLNNAIQNS